MIDNKYDLEHYSVKELASLLKVSPRTIYKYILNGTLRGYKIAEKWRFSRDQVNAFLKKLEMMDYPRYVK